MPRRKKVIYYTVPEYADTLLIPVESPQDTEAAREQALEEILRLMEDDSDETLSADSFADGLGIDRLVLVEPPASKESKRGRSKRDRELTPIEQAAADIARFSLLRVSLQEAQDTARPYLGLVEALFGSDPLTPEQVELAKSKDLAKGLSALASAKAEYDGFKETAEIAWELLKPAFAGVRAENGSAGTDTSQFSELELERG